MRRDDAFMTTCPLPEHEDRSPSLSVRWRPARPGDAGGAVMLKCFACDASADRLAAAIGLTVADLFDNPLPQKQAAGHRRRPMLTRAPKPTRPAKTRDADEDEAHQWQRVRVYTYTTAQGRPVQQVIRQECTCDAKGTHKRFLQRYRDGRRWVWERPADFQPVLYRARELDRADAAEWVWLTEGEKDAETAARLGVVATTNANGSTGFPAALLAQLAGRNVAILADRDPAGYTRAASLHAQLTANGAQTVILLAAVEETKADLTDHVQAGLWESSARFGGLVVMTGEDITALAHAQSTAAEGQQW
jgi:5S rRNA maturation endonuclease (ribonuclease M5)